MRHRLVGPDASKNCEQARAAISAASSKESGNSVADVEVLSTGLLIRREEDEEEEPAEAEAAA